MKRMALSKSFQRAVKLIFLTAGNLIFQKAGKMIFQKAGKLIFQKAGRPRLGVKGKKNGQNRQVQTLGGIKKQENALKRKFQQEKETIRKASPISVLFIDNTKGGVLANKLQEADTRLETMTNYKVRVVESPGTALSRLLPSRNPWGAGDWQARLCAVQPAG